MLNPAEANAFGTSVTSVMARSMAQDEVHRYGHTVVPGTLSSEEEGEARHVHDDSKRLFKACNGWFGCVRYIPIFGEAIECYGPKFIVALDVTYFLSKGIAYVLIMVSLNPMFLRKFGSTAEEYQRLYTVSRMGWSIKPFTALISDAFAFFKYKKRWILTLSATFGCVCSIVFGLLPATRSSAVPGAVLGFLVGYGQANMDILAEGLYSRKMRKWPKAGPALISGVWVVQCVAGIIASVMQGPLTDAGIPEVGLYVCGGCMAVCIPFYLFNWMDEQHNRTERTEDAMVHRQQALEASAAISGTTRLQESVAGKAAVPFGDEDDEKNAAADLEADEELYIPTYCGGALEFNKEVIVRNTRITVFCVLMTIVVVVTAIINLLYRGGFEILGVTLAGVFVLVGLLFWSLPLVVAKAGLFGFINQALYVNLAGPLEPFFIGGPDCNPGGPNFSYTFYNTISGIIGYVAGTLGVIGFAYIFSKRTYRLTFIITIFAEIVGSVFDLIIVKRWNLPAIPDHYFYIFGDAVVYQVAYMFAWMPMCVLLSQLCPRGSEAMVYALLAAFSNYGQTVASEIGVFLMKWAWPVPADVSSGVCDFSNLWKLILVGHMCLPCLIIVCVFFLIPSARICDELDERGDAISIPVPVEEDAGLLDDDIQLRVNTPQASTRSRETA